MDLELVNLEHPNEVRTFEKGKFELYEVGPTTLGRATYHILRSEDYAGS